MPLIRQRIPFDKKPLFNEDFELDLNHDLNRDLLWSYLLNEGGGSNVYDNSGELNHATTINTGTWGQFDEGTMLTFNGTSDGVSVPTLLTKTPFTIVAKFNCAAAAGVANYTIYGLGFTSNNNHFLLLHLDNAIGEIVFAIRAGSAGTQNTATSPFASNDGQDHTVVAVARSHNDIEVYIDGVSVATSTTNPGGFPSANTQHIGLLERSTKINYYDGGIGHVSMHQRAFTDKEALEVHENLYRSLMPRTRVLSIQEITQVINEISLSSSLGITDGSDQFKQLARLISDSLQPTDSILSQVQRMLSRALLTVVDVTDISNAYREINKNLTDSGGVTDASNIYRELNKSISDNFTVTDFEYIYRELNKSLSDSTSVTDFEYIYRELNKNLSNSINVTDLNNVFREYYKALSDSFNIDDILTATLQGRIVDAILSDSIPMSDAEASTRNLFKGLNDSAVLTEALTIFNDKITFQTLLENVVVTDEMLKQSLLFKLLVSNANITDELVSQLAAVVHARLLADNMGITDEVAIALIQTLEFWGVIETNLLLEPIDTNILKEKILTAIKK